MLVAGILLKNLLHNLANFFSINQKCESNYFFHSAAVTKHTEYNSHQQIEESSMV